MTTIATDGVSMAGDGLITDNGIITMTDCRKVRRLKDGRIVGFSGNAYGYDVFAEWLENGAEGEPPKFHDGNNGITCLALCPDGSVLTYDEHGRPFREKAPFAIGSGQRFAIAAMDLGKSPEEAVRYAATRDPFTDGEVTVLSSTIRSVEAA